MNKSYILFYIFIIICIVFFVSVILKALRQDLPFTSNDLFEGFNPTHEAYEKCGQMSDCNTCLTTMTRGDGMCYWCDGKCTASDKYHAGCSSDTKSCSRPAPFPPGPNPPGPDPNPNPPGPNPNPNCPKCIICPKLQQLKIPTFMTSQ